LSAIATFNVLPRSDLDDLVRADDAVALMTAIRKQGRQVHDEYGWSGYCMLYLLEYLDERGAYLGAPELDADTESLSELLSYAVLISAEQKSFLPDLDPANHSLEEIAAYFDDMGYGFEDEELTAAIDESMAVLSDSIAGLDEDEVLLIVIG